MNAGLLSHFSVQGLRKEKKKVSLRQNWLRQQRSVGGKSATCSWFPPATWGPLAFLPVSLSPNSAQRLRQKWCRGLAVACLRSPQRSRHFEWWTSFPKEDLKGSTTYETGMSDTDLDTMGEGTQSPAPSAFPAPSASTGTPRQKSSEKTLLLSLPQARSAAVLSGALWTAQPKAGPRKSAASLMEGGSQGPVHTARGRLLSLYSWDTGQCPGPPGRQTPAQPSPTWSLLAPQRQTRFPTSQRGLFLLKT